MLSTADLDPALFLGELCCVQALRAVSVLMAAGVCVCLCCGAGSSKPVPMRMVNSSEQWGDPTHLAPGGNVRMHEQNIICAYISPVEILPFLPTENMDKLTTVLKKACSLSYLFGHLVTSWHWLH